MYKIGYTQGVFDMFHIGHLNIIKTAKTYCEYLIVGVNSDKLTETYKNKKPIINENERVEIIRNIKGVEQAVIVDTLDKMELHKRLKFDVVFIGDDWKGNDRWNKTEDVLKQIGADVIYLPYTPNVSSSALRKETHINVE